METMGYAAGIISLGPFHLGQVTSMSFRHLTTLPVALLLCLFAAVASADERSVKAFAEYSARRIGNADLELIARFAEAVDSNGDGKVSDEEFAGRIEVYQDMFETVQPKRAQGGHALPSYWVSGFEKGIAEAKKSDRPMLVMFSASWCAPCKMMIAQVFPDEKVKAALKGMVPVYVDSEVEVDRATENGIKAYPTFVCFTSAGTAVTTRVGGGDVSKFLQMLETFKLAADATKVSGE
ncbi:MAG: hypothetical protein CMM01_24870 [Rhodopirellula sp.]|nr:hypothetical protein [Rhodopirellula sp.]